MSTYLLTFRFLAHKEIDASMFSPFGPVLNSFTSNPDGAFHKLSMAVLIIWCDPLSNQRACPTLPNSLWSFRHKVVRPALSLIP